MIIITVVIIIAISLCSSNNLDSVSRYIDEPHCYIFIFNSPIVIATLQI